MDSKGEYKPQMLEVLAASEDKMTWTFTLRPGLEFSRRQAGDLGGRGRLDQALGPARSASAAGCWRRRRRSASSMPRTLRHRPRTALRPCDRGAGQAERACPLRHARPHRQRTPPTQPVKEVVGSGPFLFLKDEWVPGEQHLLPPQPGYRPARGSRRRPGRRQAPALERVEFVTMPDVSLRAAALTAGRGGLPGIRADRLPAESSSATATWSSPRPAASARSWAASRSTTTCRPSTTCRCAARCRRRWTAPRSSPAMACRPT